MRLGLDGKNALVTGVAAGIGKACALTLADAGATVVAVDINEKGVDDTIGEIGRGLAVECDLQDPSAIQEMHDKVFAELGGVNIIVNSAGLICYRKVELPEFSGHWTQHPATLASKL